MSGADLAAVQRILRYSDPKLTTEDYAHLAPEYLRAEVDRLSFGTAVLDTVPVTGEPLDFAPPAAALRSGRTEEGARRLGMGEFATRTRRRKDEGRNPGRQASGFRPSELERETGFEPATLSLGS